MRQDGYVALLSVLIMSAAVTTIGLTLLLSGTDSQRATLVTQQSAQARSLAGACAEEALQQLYDNASYTGTNVAGPGSCTYTVTNTGGATRTIDATVTVGNVVRKIKVYATIGASSISITSWQEVS